MNSRIPAQARASARGERFGSVAQGKTRSQGVGPYVKTGAVPAARISDRRAQRELPLTSEAITPLFGKYLATRSSVVPGSSRVRRVTEHRAWPLSARGVHGRHRIRGLTLRSTRPAPAGGLGREAAQPIIGLAPQATCRHGRVTSNVMRRLLAIAAGIRSVSCTGHRIVNCSGKHFPRPQRRSGKNQSTATNAALTEAFLIHRVQPVGAALLGLPAGSASGLTAPCSHLRFVVGATHNPSLNATPTSYAPGPRGRQAPSSASRPWRSAGGRALPQTLGLGSTPSPRLMALSKQPHALGIHHANCQMNSRIQARARAPAAAERFDSAGQDNAGPQGVGRHVKTVGGRHRWRVGTQGPQLHESVG
jgi:hypothetical protein